MLEGNGPNKLAKERVCNKVSYKVLNVGDHADLPFEMSSVMSEPSTAINNAVCADRT